MWTPVVVISSLALASAVVVPRAAKYDGYQVVRLEVGKEASHVNDVISKLQLETWKPAREDALADVVIPPGVQEAFKAATAHLPSVVMYENLGEAITNETIVSTYAVDSTWFNAYHSYADHQQFLKDMQSTYASQSEIVSAGSSLEGRPLNGLHFWGSSGKNVKPAIILHGTVHAREWIGTMVVEYFLYTLLTGYASNSEIKAFVDKYDFYIFPNVNPDGFVYTQTNDRMWRKNRQSTSGSSCLGHDINRNWNYMWSVTGGASTDPCAQDFKGRAAADAPETQAHQSFIQKIKNQQGLKLYIDYHSYSQLFMSPYGYSCSALPAKNTEFQSLMKGTVAAIKAVHGVSFTYGPICSTIYQATGASVDYVSDVVKADYIFTSELRDTGNYGFLLPANQIVPSGEEAYAGLKYLLQNMK
ncbi:hypothetical protein EJ05DRAFT_27593 [Pseudovirgaria hyperparasitica]|uniref:Peptidase M14 domain-containing protein n=1 Tax=Pseudovirgaria hyperparasitica TaxID=470096 RepID=A0A6A6WMA3_9PEZI|nr:uncharacterized protein EJ05DRAFT_27593 [Pseudovirgaria hyperparasitica]KAF2763149.1 hypothetical protein EJ05DRAFT_27593 [Pseudovirgaria hyperparasitica]